MNSQAIILIGEAMLVYGLVLWVHSLRHRFGQAFFYGLLGGITAIMSWLTDAGVTVQLGTLTFWVGSTVFYTALLLGVFVVYVFDGPRPTRIAILTIAGVSAMMPVIAMVLHLQATLLSETALSGIPHPSLRINSASVVTTIADLIFLAIAWEILGKPRLHIRLWQRAFLVLLGVMWLDVILFATLAFAGESHYLSTMSGTLVSRLLVTVLAFPVLYLYLRWQNGIVGIAIENRPVLAILREVAEVRHELSLAQQEIQRRKQAEAEKEKVIAQLETTLKHVKRLEGLLSICWSCKSIRVEPDASTPPGEERWMPLDEYIREKTEVEFSHGLCQNCLKRDYPQVAAKIAARRLQEREPPSGQSPPLKWKPFS